MKFSETNNPELHKARIEYVNRRWRDLYERQLDVGDRIIKYLILINSGGAVAVLSLMGAMKTLDPVPGARWMLALFLSGIVVTGFLMIIGAYRLSCVFRGWRNDTDNYYKNELDWDDVLKQDRKRSGDFWITHALGWAVFLCFISGLVIAASGLLFG